MEDFKQGGIITGNLGTRFPGNLKVSQEVLIVYPAYFLQNTYDNPNFMRKLFSLTRKIVPLTGKILFIHIG